MSETRLPHEPIPDRWLKWVVGIVTLIAFFASAVSNLLSWRVELVLSISAWAVSTTVGAALIYALFRIERLLSAKLGAFQQTSSQLREELQAVQDSLQRLESRRSAESAELDQLIFSARQLEQDYASYRRRFPGSQAMRAPFSLVWRPSIGETGLASTDMLEMLRWINQLEAHIAKLVPWFEKWGASSRLAQVIRGDRRNAIQDPETAAKLLSEHLDLLKSRSV